MNLTTITNEQFIKLYVQHLLGDPGCIDTTIPHAIATNIPCSCSNQAYMFEFMLGEHNTFVCCLDHSDFVYKYQRMIPSHLITLRIAHLPWKHIGPVRVIDRQAILTYCYICGHFENSDVAMRVGPRRDICSKCYGIGNAIKLITFIACMVEHNILIDVCYHIVRIYYLIA